MTKPKERLRGRLTRTVSLSFEKHREISQHLYEVIVGLITLYEWNITYPIALPSLIHFSSSHFLIWMRIIFFNHPSNVIGRSKNTLSESNHIFLNIYLQVTICGVIHQSVALKSKQYLAELSRHNYVTPTRYWQEFAWNVKKVSVIFSSASFWFLIILFLYSYLELLGTFRKLVGLKKSELLTARNRTKTGLDKVSTLATLE